ncbi:hypothetical protein B0H19DRAFT_1256545 [Mycena capillaripes]|nr:hypothetical protein B0H19DRAFT_1256545 [Mycena capillaripes]
MHLPLHPQHHHGSRPTSATSVCVSARDMLRQFPPLAPPRLRRYKPFHTAPLTFTAADPTNSPPLFIPALALRIQRHVASIVPTHLTNTVHFQRLHDASHGALL